MRKSQANLARIAQRAGKSQPNYAVLTTGPIGANLAARVEVSAPALGAAGAGRNRAPKITTGQLHWDRPAHLTGRLAMVANDRRWSA